MCILHHATQLINNGEQECSWEKLVLMSFLSSFPEFLKNSHVCLFYLDSPPNWEFDSSQKSPWFIFVEKLRTSLLVKKILLSASTRIINRPFSADPDGDCVQIYYPQSLAAKAEALELFSVEKQLISSHRGTVNLQLGNDSLVATQLMSSRTISSKELANQLAIFIPLKSDILINLETSIHIGRSLFLSLSIVLLYFLST